MEQCPPPHMLWHEPLCDTRIKTVWADYCSRFSTDIDPSEIDAAMVCSVEEFSKKFEFWVTSKSSKKIKLLMVWHAHFLSLACQQSLRRWLETKSYRCRVWFHVEVLNNVQSALLSRCILKCIQDTPRTIHVVSVHEEGRDLQTCWNHIQSENELRQYGQQLTLHVEDIH
jgi:hypothetical protein